MIHQRWRITILTTLVASTLVAQAGGLTDEEVNNAINAAKQPRWASLFVEAKGRFAAHYSVLLQGPVGRTMDLGREAFESYKPLTASSVPCEMRAHELTLTLAKHSGARTEVKNVVIMPLGATSRDEAIQPLPPH